MTDSAVSIVADTLRANFEPWLQGFMANYDPCNPPPIEWLTHCIEDWGEGTAKAVVDALGGLAEQVQLDDFQGPLKRTRWVGRWTEFQP